MWLWPSPQTTVKEPIAVLLRGLPQEARKELQLCTADLGIQLITEAPLHGPYILLIDAISSLPETTSDDVIVLRYSDGEFTRHLREALLYARATRDFKK
jgi:hypothetical protein